MNTTGLIDGQNLAQEVIVKDWRVTKILLLDLDPSLFSQQRKGAPVVQHTCVLTFHCSCSVFVNFDHGVCGPP